MISSFWLNTINMGLSLVYIEGSQVTIPKIKIVFLPLEIAFVLVNSVDPDAAFHLGLHCLLI